MTLLDELEETEHTPKRYCELSVAQLYPCSVGWGSIGTNGEKNCWDEPMEENCHNIIRGFSTSPAVFVRLR